MPNPFVNTMMTDSGSAGRSTIPSNATTRTSSVGASSGATGGSYSDILRAIQNENNAFNVAQTNMVNAFNAREAEKQRQWQEYLTRNAHQIEVADLKKAGLNPVLSALNGNGASVPSGGVASGQKAVADDTLSNGIISMMSAMINASSAASVASIYANASMYAADVNAANNIRTNNTNSENNIRTNKTSSDNSIRSNETSARNNDQSNTVNLLSNLLRYATLGAGYQIYKKGRR